MSSAPLANASIFTKSSAATAGSFSSSYPAGIAGSNRWTRSARAPSEARTWSSQSSAMLMMAIGVSRQRWRQLPCSATLVGSV